MKETGRVLTVTGDSVILQHDISAACFGCMKQECRQKQGLITAENKTGLPLSAGQQVETDYPLKTALAQGLPLLVLPFLACIAAYTVSGLLSPAPDDATRAAIGAVALFAAGFALFFYRRKRPFRTWPQVVRIVEPDSRPNR
jgi:sigma-E factor negative regulatory protein RseC